MRGSPCGMALCVVYADSVVSMSIPSTDRRRAYFINHAHPALLYRIQGGTSHPTISKFASGVIKMLTKEVKTNLAFHFNFELEAGAAAAAEPEALYTDVPTGTTDKSKVRWVILGVTRPRPRPPPPAHALALVLRHPPTPSLSHPLTPPLARFLFFHSCPM